MMQQVDLIPEVLRPKYDPLNLKNVCAGVVLFALMMVAYGGFSQFSHDQLELRVTNLQTEKQQTIELISSLSQIIANKTQDTGLLARADQLKAEVESNEKLIELVKLTSIGTTKGFHQALQDLSEFHLNGVWLSEIKLQEGGSDILLRGGAVSADKIPEYLASLEKGVAFKGVPFKVIQLKRGDDQSQIIEFLLSSEPEKEVDALEFLAAD